MSRGDRPRPSSERTDADRERDRLERERRRAATSHEAPLAPAAPAEPPGASAGPPVAPAESFVTPAGPPVASAEPPVAPAESFVTPAEPFVTPGEPSVAPAEPPAAPAEPAVTPVDPPAPVAQPAPAPEPAPAEPPSRAPGPAPGETDDWLVPPVPLEEFTAARRRERRRGRGRGARLALLVALAAVIAAVVLLVDSLRPGHKKTLAAPKVVRVLIPEGQTRAQIALLAKRAGLTGSYADAARRSKLIELRKFGAPRHTDTLEGFLFPATYDMNTGDHASLLVEKQLVAFAEHFGAADVKRARELHVTPYGLLTVASMIEREAQVPGDRAKIAAVIYNRLRADMPLGIDATIYYAVELQKHVAVYTHELTNAQLHIDSPYNTRVHTGLPPTPISNPGAASIHAAAHPAHVGYLYYVAGADGCGEQAFSDTAAAFEADVAAYEAAKAHNGGHPPSCKHK